MAAIDPVALIALATPRTGRRRAAASLRGPQATFCAVNGSSKNVDFQPLWLAQWVLITMALDVLSISILDGFFAIIATVSGATLPSEGARARARRVAACGLTLLAELKWPSPPPGRSSPPTSGGHRRASGRTARGALRRGRAARGPLAPDGQLGRRR